MAAICSNTVILELEENKNCFVYVISLRNKPAKRHRGGAPAGLSFNSSFCQNDVQIDVRSIQSGRD